MMGLTTQLKALDWSDEEKPITTFFAHQAVYFKDLTDQLVTITGETKEFDVRNGSLVWMQLY